MNKWINGQIVPMTDEEINEMLIEQNKAKLAEMQSASVTSADLFNALLAGIPVTMPNGQTTTADKLADQQIDLPVKLGYKWQMVSSNGAIVWESVVDENAIGTNENNAIIYFDGCPLINNAFYKFADGSIKVWMGEWVDW